MKLGIASLAWILAYLPGCQQSSDSARSTSGVRTLDTEPTGNDRDASASDPEDAGLVDAEPEAPLECSLGCDPSNLGCPDLSAIPIGTLEETRPLWFDTSVCRYYDVLEGQCEGDVVFLARLGDFLEVRYFEPTGEFKSLTVMSDDSDGDCGGRAEWPEYYACEGPLVTEEFCGNASAPKPGASVRLP